MGPTVNDVMSPNPFCLEVGKRVSDAAWEMKAELIGGAPVRDEKGAVVGMVSVTDLLDVDRLASVRNVMQREITSVRPGTPIVEAARIMLDKGFHRLPVMTEGGTLVGILSTLDVIRALLDR